MNLDPHNSQEPSQHADGSTNQTLRLLSPQVMVPPRPPVCGWPRWRILQTISTTECAYVFYCVCPLYLIPNVIWIISCICTWTTASSVSSLLLCANFNVMQNVSVNKRTENVVLQYSNRCVWCCGVLLRVNVLFGLLKLTTANTCPTVSFTASVLSVCKTNK